MTRGSRSDQRLGALSQLLESHLAGGGLLCTSADATRVTLATLERARTPSPPTPLRVLAPLALASGRRVARRGLACRWHSVRRVVRARTLATLRLRGARPCGAHERVAHVSHHEAAGSRPRRQAAAMAADPRAVVGVVMLSRRKRRSFRREGNKDSIHISKSLIQYTSYSQLEARFDPARPRVPWQCSGPGVEPWSTWSRSAGLRPALPLRGHPAALAPSACGVDPGDHRSQTRIPVRGQIVTVSGHMCGYACAAQTIGAAFSCAALRATCPPLCTRAETLLELAHLHETIVEVADGLVQAADANPAAARLRLRKPVVGLWHTRLVTARELGKDDHGQPSPILTAAATLPPASTRRRSWRKRGGGFASSCPAP
jgi:hypothetical protein